MTQLLELPVTPLEKHLIPDIKSAFYLPDTLRKTFSHEWKLLAVSVMGAVEEAV